MEARMCGGMYACLGAPFAWTESFMFMFCMRWLRSAMIAVEVVKLVELSTVEDIKIACC